MHLSELIFHCDYYYFSCREGDCDDDDADEVDEEQENT